MNSKGPPAAAHDENGMVALDPDRGLILRLYIAGRGPNSVRALANLDALAQAYGHDRFEVEIVDVLLDPQRALRDHVLVTPTLVKMAPLPTIHIAGDLSDGYRVVYALGLDPGVVVFGPGE